MKFIETGSQCYGESLGDVRATIVKFQQESRSARYPVVNVSGLGLCRISANNCLRGLNHFFHGLGSLAQVGFLGEAL